jgi:hypothetical protein
MFSKYLAVLKVKIYAILGMEHGAWGIGLLIFKIDMLQSMLFCKKLSRNDNYYFDNAMKIVNVLRTK